MSRTRLVIALALLGPFLWFFGSVLLGGQMFVYRDVGHYYCPLFEWTRCEWSQGRVPLWNPQENLGEPLAADATASVFYPGKLVFALPLDFATGFKLYVIGHFVLAVWAAYTLARHWQASPLAAAVCGMSYAFGGSVLIQYANVVYLVSAAWLPLAVLAADKMLRQRRAIWAAALGAILALMVLGGDPQTAYHAGLLAALYALILWRNARRQKKIGDSSDTVEESLLSTSFFRRLFTHRLLLLSLAATCGALLAAVQILPSIQWTRRSGRAAFDRPRNIYEIPTQLARNKNETRRESDGGAPSIADGLLGVPSSNTHHHHIYQYSVGPWRLPELVWPNFSGRTYPTHRRWTQAIPAEGRIWSPSLYMGLLPLLLAVGSFRLWGAAAPQRWMSWTVLLAALGALGWYGLGWLIHELRCGLAGAAHDDVLLGQPVGGLYWLMVTVLPGYAYFRYPAKLLVVAALGASVLAAIGWDRTFSKKPEGLRRVVAILAGLSIAATVAALIVQPFWETWMQSVVPDSYFGPLDVDGSANDLLASTIHAILLCGILWWVLGRICGKKNSLWTGVALLITALDLIVANGWMVASAPQEIWRQQPQMAMRIEAEEKQRATPDAKSFRVFRDAHADWQPPTWSEDSSRRRHIEGLRWDRNTLFPKHHLQTKLSLCESTGSMNAYDYRIFLAVSRQWSHARPTLDVLAARYLVLPENSVYPSMQRLDDLKVENATLWRNPHALLRAWIVHDVEKLPPLKTTSPSAIHRRTERVLISEIRNRDLKKQAVVETDTDFSQTDKRLAPASILAADESCRIVVDQSQHVAIDVELTTPGLVVLSDLYYPGWKAQVSAKHLQTPQTVPVFRTNRVMRGVYLPAGQFRIDYHYRPKRFYTGLIVSAVAWMFLIVLGVVMWRRKWKPDSENTAGKPAR